MQYHFFKNLYQNKLFIFSFFIAFTFSPIFCWASSPTFFSSVFSPLDTTLIIQKDVYPKVINKQERLIEGKKYVFATINERKGMVALSGNFLSEMARAAGVEVTDFLDWNDMKPTDAIKTGQVYYLQSKGNRAKDVATHVLRNDETLWDVSQKYAMEYKHVLKYNRLSDDDKVKVGRVLWIQTKRPKRIPVEVRDVTPIVASFNESEEDETAADPELMAEWDELKKTELAGLDNKEKNKENKTTTTVIKNNTTNSDSEQGSFAEFEDNSKTKGVIISEKANPEKQTNTATNVIKYHTVAEAESLYTISKNYNVLMPTLKEWNNLSDDYLVSTGQKLIVSQSNSSNADKVYEGNLITEKKDTQNTNSSDKKVVVRQNANGDFVNFIDSSGILLPVPQQDFRPIAPNIGDKNYHFVEKDETLYSIARKYGLNPLDVIRWNGFVQGNNIDVGDKIILNSSLALPVGSRVEVAKSNSTTNTTGNSELIDPAISNGVKTETTTSSNQTTASKLTRDEILAMGGNPDKAGKDGYDELGTPIVGYIPKKKEDGTTTKTIETETKAAFYIVQPKDMLGKIAQKFSITTKEMMLWNPRIPTNGTIYKGDTLFVSQPKIIQTVTEQKTQPATVYPADYYGAGFHVVQRNENVYNLSERYAVPIANIWKWNNLETSVIDLPVGKKMIVSEGVLKMENTNATNKNNTVTTQVNYLYHNVEKGETIFSIAQKYNLSTAQVREWNSRQGDLVYEGEKLIIGIK